MAEYTLASLAKFLTDAADEGEKSDEDALKKACEMIRDEAKRVIGTYDYGWPPLAPATIADRTRLGYAPDEPLLRTGELRDSIEYEIIEPGKLGEVFTDDPIAAFLEYGTSTIPPRSHLEAAAAAMEPKIEAEFGDRFEILWNTGRAPLPRL